MPAASRGSAVLLVGTVTTLFIALVASFLRARAFVQTVPVSDEPPAVLTPLADPYRALLPPVPLAAAYKGRQWTLVPGDGACALFDAAAPTSSLGSVAGAWCALPGVSIEGRFVHLLAGDSEACTQEPCERPAVRAWQVYDLRSHTLHPVPMPVRGGRWEAVDPVRSVGLFMAPVRSTLHPGAMSEYWALTDVAGAALWTGAAADIDPDAARLYGERLLSRPDGGLLLSYLRIGDDGSASLGLAKYAGKAWHRIELPEAVRAKAWRLETWEQKGKGWTAGLAFPDGDGRRAELPVAAP